MTSRLCGLFLVWLASIAMTRLLFAEEALLIPLKPDPPISIDGDLSDWSRIPNEVAMADAVHCTHGRDRWHGESDLACRAHLAWRPGVLYVGVEVTDDVISIARGRDMWKSDHVELYLDTTPDSDTARSSSGPGQWQFGFSPGNFKRTGDALIDAKSEVICFYPENLDPKDIQLAAQKTKNGYVLEAAIPLDLIGLRNAAQGQELSGELAISDSDSSEPTQEKMLTLSTAPWSHARSRLKPMVFGDAAGKGAVPPRSFDLGRSLNIEAGDAAKVNFTSPEIPPGKDAYVSFKARIPFDKVGGSKSNALKLVLNRKAVDGARFSNRPAVSKTLGGTVETLVAPSGEATVYYSPDFTAPDKDAHYGLADGAKTCEFEYRVTDLLQHGENGLVLHNQCTAIPESPRNILIADARLMIKAPPPPPKARRAAPTGDIPTIVPQQRFTRTYHITQKSPTTLEATIGNTKYAVESRFSSPDGKWNRGSSKFFEHKREITEQDEAVLVSDTFRNLTDQDLPIMQRHECNLAERLSHVWLAGVSPVSNSGAMHDPVNPTSFAATATTGIGLMAMNDEFMVHVNNSCVDGKLGLSDNEFVLPPHGTYTAEWAIIPVRTADFWDFVNSARRVRDANFTLPYQYAFLRAGPKPVGGDVWPDELIRQFVVNKGADLVTASNKHPRFTDPAYASYTEAYATMFQKVDHSVYAEQNERIRRLVPGVRTMVYYHSFLDNFPPDVERFKADRVLKSDGTQLDYGGQLSSDKVFLPTLDNGFGRETAKNIDLIFDACKADGVYWDEIEYSAAEFHYGEPWDSVSGDIDPATFKLVRKKSSVVLLSQPFRVELIKRILKRGPLIANGMPYTRTVAALKFERFTETGSITNCAKAILYSPIALGDHLTEHNEEDCYHCMLAALDYGCVYNWYDDHVIPTHKTLASYMFPITPMELHEGYIIGHERVVTKKSGLYGWNDASDHEVHVFNEKGEEVAEPKAPLLRRDGQTLTELRLPEDWSAAIVHKPRMDNLN